MIVTNWPLLSTIINRGYEVWLTNLRVEPKYNVRMFSILFIIWHVTSIFTFSFQYRTQIKETKAKRIWNTTKWASHVWTKIKPTAH